MKVIIVYYRAFDMPHSKAFLNKTYEQIHESLTEICGTYVPTCILECSNPENKPLILLEKLKK